MTSWLKESDRIYIGSDLGEEATNERGLAETVDDTQGIEVGETGKVRYHEICDLSSTCVCLQLYRYIL
jgi:RecB family exonuclease